MVQAKKAQILRALCLITALCVGTHPVLCQEISETSGSTTKAFGVGLEKAEGPVAEESLLSEENAVGSLALLFETEELNAYEGFSTQQLIRAAVLAIRDDDETSLEDILLAGLDPETKIELDISLLEEPDDSMLHLACVFDAAKCAQARMECEKILIDYGADPNAKTSLDHVPLHHCASIGSTRTTQVLVDNGAEVDSTDLGSTASLHFASRKGYIDIVQILILGKANVNITNLYKITPLHLACYNKTFEVIEALVNAGADLNAKTNDGFTPLHFAVDSDEAENVEFLLKEGAEISPLTIYGHTPLHQSCINGSIEVTELLINYGADLDVVGAGGYTALSLASHYGLLDTVKLLIESGADLNKRDYDGYTPIIEAMVHNHTDIAEVLVEAKVDVNTTDGDGFTPLHFAVLSDHAHLVELLLEAGAYVDARNKDGRTPLHAAAIVGYPEVIDVLLKYGANIEQRDADGILPVDLVCLSSTVTCNIVDKKSTAVNYWSEAEAPILAMSTQQRVSTSTPELEVAGPDEYSFTFSEGSLATAGSTFFVEPSPREGDSGDGVKIALKFLLSNVAAGIVIGKAGTNITLLQEASGARIQLSRNNVFYPGTAERVLLLTGSVKSVLLALYLILVKLTGRTKWQATKMGESVGQTETADSDAETTQVKIVMPSAVCGAIIGRGGETVRGFADDSGASISVSPQERNVRPDRMGPATDRIVTITGGVQQILRAVALIVTTVAEDPNYVRNVGLSVNYAPRPTLNLPSGLLSPGGGRGSFSAQNGTPTTSSGSFTQPFADPSFFASQQAPNLQRTSPSHGGRVESKLSVPDEHVGAIIGKGGEILSQLQELVGVKVTISGRGEFEPGTRNRVVSITGPPDAVNIGQMLITQKVNERIEQLTRQGSI